MNEIQTEIVTTAKKKQTLQLACKTLARVCDGAIEQDDQGFNKPDSWNGHLMAYRSEWNNTEARDMCAVLKKYRKQLENYGVDLADISPEDFPVIGEQITPELLIDLGKDTDSSKGVFHVHFPYSSALVKLMKENGGVYGAKFYNDPYCRFWTFPTTEFRLMKLFMENEGFTLTNYAWLMVEAMLENPPTEETQHVLENETVCPNCNKADGVGEIPYRDKYHEHFCSNCNVPFREGVSIEDENKTDAEAAKHFESVVEKKSPNRIENDNGVFVIYFPFSYDQLNAVKNILGRKFNPTGYDEKVWTVQPNATNYHLIDEYITNFKVSFDETVEGVLSTFRTVTQANLEDSRAEDADIELNYGIDLFPFQRAGVKYAIRAERTFIADEMGLGKTHQATATVNNLKAFPCLVVCPASLKFNWMKEILKGCGKQTKVSVWDGSGGVRNADFIIINYDLLSKHETKLSTIGFKSVIMDESHYLKNGKAKRTKSMKEIVKNIDFRFALTGTPVLNRPNELISQLDILGRLNDFGGFWNFAKRYCNAHQVSIGRKTVWDLNGAINLQELNQNLRKICFIRRKKMDVLKEMPSKLRADVTLEIDNRKEYNEAQANVFEFLDFFTKVQNRVLSDEDFLKSLEGLSPAETEFTKANRVTEAQVAAQKAEAIVQINTLKKLAAKGKLQASIDWIENFLESGEKLVVFCEHIEIQKTLQKHFNALHVFGDDSAQDRQTNVDKFQNDPKHNLIVCSLQAAGVGITLTASSNVAFIEQGWTPALMLQAEDRVHRIGQTSQVTAWYLLAENTIDEYIGEILRNKQAICEAAVDGDSTAKNTSILSQLISKIKEGKEK